MVDPTGHEPHDDCSYTGKCYTDLTDWLISEMNSQVSDKNVQAILKLNGIEGDFTGITKLEAMYGFAELVRSGARYDFKDAIRVEYKNLITLAGMKFPDGFQMPGNIFFGFLAAATGFAKVAAHGGAGLVELVDYVKNAAAGNKPKITGDKSTFYDGPDDYAAIEFGYSLYEKAYKSDGKVTRSEFLSLITSYSEKMGGSNVSPKDTLYPNPPIRVGFFNGKDNWILPMFMPKMQ